MTDIATPEEALDPATKAYACLKDMPADILAGRVVSSLIMAKGNINMWQGIVENLIEEIRKEYV